MSGRIRGALIGVDPFNLVSSAAVFQINPEQMIRTVTSSFPEADPTKVEVVRLKGPPTEKITFTLKLSAANQLGVDDPMTRRHGIHPQLAALEMLVYPKSARVIANTAKLMLGTIEIIPQNAPLTFFTWGLKRVVPVKVESLTITETLFDEGLNPIYAEVSVALVVLNYNDLPHGNPGYVAFLAHQMAKETLATANSLHELGDITQDDVAIF